MSRRRADAEPPPLYAVVVPGLETVAAEEITQELGGTVRKTAPGLVVFRLPEITDSVLRLRTTEDVFLLAWGTDKLTHRAEDLDKIRRWTAHEADWQQLLRLHHSIRPKPAGKPTYHLVTQMQGHHAYRRMDAGKELARGLAGKFPASWRPAEESAAVEVWLTIDGATAVCGLRLSDRTMRHRTYKLEHVPASLRPTVAAAMVRLADARSGEIVFDPMCGAGTLLAEQLAAARQAGSRVRVIGGDLERSAVKTAAINLRRLGEAWLARWDAARLPLPDAAVERVITNLPFGKQLATPAQIGPLYRRVVRACDRVLRPGGQAVLLVSDFGALRTAVQRVGWQPGRRLEVRVLGQRAVLSVWRKEAPAATI